LVYRDSDITQRAIFASDTVKLSDQWSALLGLRSTNYEQNSYSIAGARSSQYTKDGVVTPTLALMFKPAPDTTLYTSYVESLEQGASVGITYANFRDLLNPLKSKQYELGIKTQRDRWSATAALFRIERGAEYANSQNVLVQDGQSIYQGLELGAATRLGSQWQLGGNLMFLDTSYQRAATLSATAWRARRTSWPRRSCPMRCRRCRVSSCRQTRSTRAAPCSTPPTS
jgi:iron complex outermembrane receptor protein